MIPILPFLRRSCPQLLLLVASLLVLPAWAGNISFSMTLNDNKLTLTNQGNSSAFHPVAYRMLADGAWEALSPAPGVRAPVEMKPNMQFDSIWPNNRPPAQQTPLEALRPIMVRFFDQAGADFGQISFFNYPPHATTEWMVRARYVDGLMTIMPPKNPAIRASWLLWPQESGIAPLTEPVTPEHQQPAARRIEWQAGAGKMQFDLGEGLPTAFLLHETDGGYQVQIVADGRVQGRQQRAGWLDAFPRFYFAARLAIAAALALLIWQLVGSWRNRRAGTIDR